jgi:hypothetical protein
MLRRSFSTSDEIYYIMSFVELDPSEVKRCMYEAISVGRRKHDKKFRLQVNPSIFIGISKIKRLVKSFRESAAAPIIVLWLWPS